MAKTLYQNKNGTLEPISWMPFVSTTEAELQGKTYPKGTIIHVTDGEDFTEITQDDITLADGVTSAEFFAQKQGHIVTLSGRFNFACGSSGTKRIATMPSGFRPKNFREITFLIIQKTYQWQGESQVMVI